MKRDANFYPERAELAWPDGCPCCGEVLSEFEPENEEQYPLWAFACGCEIVLEDGNVWVNDDCPDAMRQHLEGLVIHTSEAISTEERSK